MYNNIYIHSKNLKPCLKLTNSVYIQTKLKLRNLSKHLGVVDLFEIGM